MRTLRFKVSGQELIRAPGCDFSNIIAGTSGYLQAAFEFGPEPDVAVEYIADTKTYIANEHAKMQASFDRQISAILATLPTETQAAMINNETSTLLAESEV